MQLNGSQILIECLLEQGVDTIFGYPGGAILNVYDELYRYQDKIRHVLTSHEQGASHAADGYARSTGKVGVCMATSGPGATNLVTGIATAYMDSVPMVAITCNVGLPLLGKDSFQEVDIAGITMPITKHSFIVKDINDLAKVVRRAFAIAQTGRPGPVLVDITKDVTAAVTEFTPQTPDLIQRQTDTICEKDIEDVLQAIRKAEKPMIFVGGGCILSGASAELKEFVKKVDAPVTDTLMGKGAFDGTDEYYTGMLGMHGTKTANLSVTECDLLLALGVRFSDRVTGNAKKFAKNAKILQIDIDPAEMNKNIIIDQGVVGDIKAVLRKLNEVLPQQDHTEWMKKIQDYKDSGYSDADYVRAGAALDEAVENTNNESEYASNNGSSDSQKNNGQAAQSKEKSTSQGTPSGNQQTGQQTGTQGQTKQNNVAGTTGAQNANGNNGSGNNSGSTGGSGQSGTGAGWNRGNNAGQERDAKTAENVTIPDGESGQDENLTGKANSKGSSQKTTSDQANTWSGNKVDYGQVSGSYKKKAYKQIDGASYPAELKKQIRNYFDGLN